MPALFHTLPREDFDHAKSEVLNWLRQQPEILNAMFDYYKDTGAIVFRNGRWQGVENGK